MMITLMLTIMMIIISIMAIMIVITTMKVSTKKSFYSISIYILVLVRRFLKWGTNP